jgi:hypothetical protein
LTFQPPQIPAFIGMPVTVDPKSDNITHHARIRNNYFFTANRKNSVPEFFTYFQIVFDMQKLLRFGFSGTEMTAGDYRHFGPESEMFRFWFSGGKLPVFPVSVAVKRFCKSFY